VVVVAAALLQQIWNCIRLSEEQVGEQTSSSEQPSTGAVPSPAEGISQAGTHFPVRQSHGQTHTPSQPVVLLVVEVLDVLEEVLLELVLVEVLEEVLLEG
jgi:hypothetical protein